MDDPGGDARAAPDSRRRHDGRQGLFRGRHPRGIHVADHEPGVRPRSDLGLHGPEPQHPVRVQGQGPERRGNRKPRIRRGLDLHPGRGERPSGRDRTVRGRPNDPDRELVLGHAGRGLQRPRRDLSPTGLDHVDLRPDSEFLSDRQSLRDVRQHAGQHDLLLPCEGL